MKVYHPLVRLNSVLLIRAANSIEFCSGSTYFSESKFSNLILYEFEFDKIKLVRVQVDEYPKSRQHFHRCCSCNGRSGLEFFSTKTGSISGYHLGKLNYISKWSFISFQQFQNLSNELEQFYSSSSSSSEKIFFWVQVWVQQNDRVLLSSSLSLQPCC